MKRLITLSLCCLYLAGCATTSGVSKGSSAPERKSEANIVATLANYAQTYSVPTYPAVFPVEGVNVKVYKDSELPLADYKTFKFDYTNKTNPLLEKELFSQLQRVLESRGMRRVENDPQISISMDFFIGKKEQYTPPTTVTNTEIKTVWNSGFWGWNAAGYSQSVPVTTSTTTPGYTTTTYYTNIRLNFLDYAKLMAKGKKLEAPPMIWMGEADNEGKDSDIRVIAPVLFNELAGEYPDQSSKAPNRQLRLYRYSGLGLEFDPGDWRVVRYVEPGSAAAEAGIQPGDMLLKINGKTVHTFVGQSLWYIPNSDNYRADDTYYQNVLANKAGAEVSVEAKRAGSAEKLIFKLKPRNEDRFIYVDSSGTPIKVP